MPERPFGWRLRPVGRRARDGSRTGLALIAALLPVACDSGLEARRADLCRRALPALAATGTVPEIQRIGTGATADVVRIDFRVAGAQDKGNRPHWLLCRFEPGRDAFVAVTTDEGTVSGASLYLLRRYYLDALEGSEDAGGGR